MTEAKAMVLLAPKPESEFDHEWRQGTSWVQVYRGKFKYNTPWLMSLIEIMKGDTVETAMAYGKPVHRKQATWRTPTSIHYGFGQANTNFVTPENEWPELCQHAMAWVRQREPDGGHNAVHVNLYPIEVAGKRVASGLGAHQDDEPAMVKGSTIWSFSAYINKNDTRRFLILNMDGKTNATDPVDLGDGDVVVMGGEMQEHFKHAVVGTKRKSADVRINLTVRHLKSN